jgi:hypothetical protein
MDRKKHRRTATERMRRRVRRNGGGGGCSEGCWQHRLLSRCYIEWTDEYLRRSTSCGFFFNQANLLRSPSTSTPLSGSPISRPPSHPPSLPPSRACRFPLARIMARGESSCLCAVGEIPRAALAARRRIFLRPFVILRARPALQNHPTAG